MSGKKSLLHRLNTELEEGWEAKLKPDGRIYYVNHKTQTSSWLPPRENWHDTTGLPYGWETALDGNEKPYFINHVEKYTTREDPRQDPDYVEPPRPREVELVRDIEKGFGFVAGSEKPVVVRFVTEGGPSVDKLLPGDLILKINGEEVRRAPREKVIELVRSCRHSIVLTVCQPYSDNSSRKSAILTAAKKAKLKNNPSRVRFADAIMVNGASVASQQSPQESYMPFMPNVLKVFLENGQTKSFKYDNKTTVKDVVNSLQEKLNITLTQHFCLVLQNMKSNVPGKMTLLQEHETLAELAAKPAARHFRCLFRVAFVPHDAYDLLKEDPIAFEYFYMQCCNDVIHERFASEMKYDTALRLAALQIQQHAMSNNMTGKISIKAIEKESGLDKFVAHSLLENMKTKDLRKMLAQYMKMNQSLTAPGQKQLSALQAKLHYMKIVSELKTFGSRVFMVTLLDQKSEAMVLVGPKAGVSVVTNIKSYTLTQLADFDQIENIKVTKDGENMHRVDLRVKINNKVETIGLGLLMDDAQNFVSMVAGYYHIFVDRDKRIVERTVGKNTSDPNVPSYEAQHRVLLSPWAYPEDLVSEVVDPDLGVGGVEDEKVIDLSQEPPQYEEDEEYLSKIKQELGIKTDVSIEMAPSISEPPDLSDIIALASPGKISNGRSFEEGVTSFGRTSNGGDDSSSLNSSFSSQGASFKTVISASNNSSRAGSSTDLTSAHKNQNTSPISLMTFKASPQGRRGQPVLIANTESSRSAMASTSEVVINNQSPPPNSINTSASSSMNNSDSGFARNRSDRSLSDNNSSTTSLLGEEATERQALLGNKRDPSPQRAGVLSAARTNGGLDAESDTDSTGTPGGSPAKGRQLRRNSSIESALQSFGLHSPDMVPGADVDFQDLEENVKVTPNGTVEAINSVYSTQVYGRQRMYYDPDIIDLTNFPPPATPDDDSMLDFTELSNFPPPVFSSNSSLSSFAKNEQDPSRPPVLPPRSSSTPSRLERSASTGNCPDFLDDDIDALIAQFTIPPPPSSSEMSSDSHAFANSFSGAMPSSEFSLSFSGDTSGDTLDDEFAHLIIPPPPASSTSTPQAEEAPVVPASAPGSSSSVNRNEKTENASAKTSKMVFRHKRSSSLDVNSIRAARDQMDSASRSKSLDANRNNIDSTVSPPPSDNENLSARSDKTITGDSPATVSEKLHSLLQSLPNFAPELTRRSSDNDLVRTGSLRIYRSASLDFNPAAQKPSHSDIAPSDSTGFLGNSSSVPIFSRSSSLRLKPASRRPRSQSYDVTSELRMGRSNSETLASTADGSKSGKSNSNKDLDKTSSSSGSESFATLKAKLKDYRDMLLNRNKSTASKKYMMNEDSGQSSDSKKGSLGRSNSFTKLINQFNRRGSKSDDQTESLASADSNWELKEARPVTPPPPSGELVPESGNEKRVPVVRDALGLNRATLRPVSNTILNQTKTRKSGPLKALQSVLGGDDNNNMGAHQSKTWSGKKSGKPGHKHNQQQHSRVSKDDLSMAHSQTKEKVKANPYATIKMWRPISMSASSVDGAPDDDVYQTYTNFDALRLNLESDPDPTRGRLPATGDLRNEEQLPPHRRSHAMESGQNPGRVPQMRYAERADWASRNGTGKTQTSSVNGFVEIPADYSRDNSPAPVTRRVSFRDEDPSNKPPVTNGRSNEVSSHNPTKSSRPPPLPSSPPPIPSSQPPSSPPPLPSSPPPTSPSSKHNTSFQVVSDGATNSIKLVLSHSYADADLAGKDVERLLAELKLTMDSLQSSRIDKNPSQLSMCLSELHSQTKQFINDAKLVVSSANNSQEKMLVQLEYAVHTLARLFLHGQATMLMMTSSHQAQNLGFQLIKAANSFKSTVGAANAAVGKALNDPHMKYLMRQATNLASLLGSLINSIKEIQAN